MVVTSDRDLAFAVSRFGATAISSQRFEDTMEHIDEGAEWGAKDESREDLPAGTKKKGPAKRIPKHKRAVLQTIKRL